MITLKGDTLINAPAHEVFEKLVNPQEQPQWNTLYLEAAYEPKGEIKNGTVMTGKFKGSGKATVIFENVIPDHEFTHYSKLKLFNLINLGEFRHNYKVENINGKTKFTQTIFLQPKGLGKLLKSGIIKGFKKRMPESFEEFKRYAER